MGDVVVTRGASRAAGPGGVGELTGALMGEGAEVDMSTDLAGLHLPVPVLTASGCAAAGRELSAFVDLTSLGAMVTKSVMVDPRAGRPTPRMAETPSGMLNSIGLQGPGIEAFCAEDLPWLVDHGVRVVVSIAGQSVDEYGRLARRLRDAPGVSALEVNISCPNVDNRGLVFACQTDTAAAVVQAVRRADPGVPVLVKLSPDVTDIVAIAEAVLDAGADGLTLINTLLGMVIDTDTLRPALAGVTGGLSGPAIRPVAVRAIYQVHAAYPQVPILGVGGVASGRDALELVAAGARAVSVGTAVFGDPSAPARVLVELRAELARRGFRRFSDVVGAAHRLPADQGADPPAPGVESARDGLAGAPAPGAEASLAAPGVGAGLAVPGVESARAAPGAGAGLAVPGVESARAGLAARPGETT